MVASGSFRDNVDLVAGGRVAVDPEEFELIRDGVAAGDDWYVTAVVHHEDRVAFVRNRWSDGWVLPGGGIEAGESRATAIEREIREETGLVPEAVAPLAYVERTFVPEGADGRAVATGARVADRPSVTAHMACFDAVVADPAIGEDLGVTPDEIEDAAWFDALPERIDGLSRDLLTALVERSECHREP